MVLGERRKTKKTQMVYKLQLTSMMDMFTIILIFLLFSFSDNPETLKLEKNLELPESTAKLDSSKNIELVLTQSELLLEGNRIAKVDNGEISGFNDKNLKNTVLYKQLSTYHDNLTSIDSDSTKENKSFENEKSKSHILFLCDKRHSFKTINNVMKAAGMAGFTKFQFAVLNKE